MLFVHYFVVNKDEYIYIYIHCIINTIYVGITMKAFKNMKEQPTQ